MTAHPFGGHPTFAKYLEWATSIGCKVSSGYAHDDEGKPHGITRIESPDGERWVIEAATQEEYLVPTTIDRLDRRLGIKSPFFSLPHPNPNAPER